MVVASQPLAVSSAWNQDIGSASVLAQWVLVTVDVRVAPEAFLNISGIVECTSHFHCFIQAVGITPAAAYTGYAYSSTGFQASAQINGDRLVSEWIPLVDPQDVGIQSGWHLTSDDGPVVTEAILASEPGTFNVEVTPASALKEIRTGLSGVQSRYAHEFDAVADAFVPGAGVGAMFEFQTTVTNGLIAGFEPWFTSPQIASWSGPGVHGGCTMIPPVAFCPPAGVVGPPGAWEFDALDRVTVGHTTDHLWLVYLDEAVPT
jgi:hypothetical protein